jgi:hypothetical protein
MRITTLVTELNEPTDGYDLGSTQVSGLPVTAPAALVRDILTYALAVEKGYRTPGALLADGYEFAPEGPGWYDGEGNPEDAAWCWDYAQDAPAAPAYVTGR